MTAQAFPFNENAQLRGDVASINVSYGAAVGVAGGLLVLGLTSTAPWWGTMALLGGSVFAANAAIYIALEN